MWGRGPDEHAVAESLAEYDLFYAKLRELYTELSSRYGRVVVYDLHSYNHRRDGPDGPEADPTSNPQVNLGTGTMLDRARWAPVVDAFLCAVRGYAFPAGPLDARENVKFRGRHFARWTHANFPESICVLSIDVKKLFMDEWTGAPNPALVEEIGRAIASTIDPVLEALAGLR